MRVVQIVSTIIGEGVYAGMPCLLVRLGGCNLHCNWCDTPAARHGGKEIPFSSLVDRGIKAKQKWILLTGGEPLIHRSVSKLVKRWSDGKKFILIETNGTQNIEKVQFDRTYISMDIKTPSSGESGKHLISNLKKLRSWDSVKFVIADRTDFNWAKEFIERNPVKSPILFQPVWGRLSPKRLAQWIYEEIPEVRLSVQLHKLIKLP